MILRKKRFKLEELIIEIKNGNAYCGQHWKEIKLYDDGHTDMINVCEMLVKIQSE